MKFVIAGNCPKCASPLWVPTIWQAVVPPAPYYTCNCFGQQKVLVPELAKNISNEQEVKELLSKVVQMLEDAKRTQAEVEERLKKLEGGTGTNPARGKEVLFG